MWLLYLEAFLTGAVLLCSTSEVRNSRATLVGMGVSDRVRASVRISTICIGTNLLSEVVSVMALVEALQVSGRKLSSECQAAVPSCMTTFAMS